ncbi:helix-turn-helix domain-containing protein [Arthrobacter sp. StoSoilB22]|uniref:helix-turn-helix domain-containing protein n=1 Tax=Arthrobacter sp. StoSoilB22 TaxID=2830996 RepID=UPI001CC33F40|nr:helix-turn-helix domain-containing protein [Arthrobacter sp. StoSoilB22]
MTPNETQRGDATVAQVAEYLQYHPVTVRTMARSGEFPNAYKSGSGKRNSPLRIPWADVDRWRERQPRASR